MDPSGSPELQRQPQGQVRAPKLQHVVPEAASAESPKTRPARAFQLPGLWRTIALLLIVIAGLLMLSGDDAKRVSSRPPSTAPEIIPHEIVIDFRDDITDDQIRQIGQSVGVPLEYNSEHSRASKLMVGTVAPARRDEVLRQLRQNKLVEGAEPQYVYRIQANTWIPNDPDYARQWHLKVIGVERAWSRTRGKGAVVAIIDSGLGAMTTQGYRQAQDFAQTHIANAYDFIGRDTVPEDSHGHGTHVAGTIAESTNNGLMGAGIAPEATIMPLRIAGPDGAGRSSALIDALRYAVDHGAHVVNMSVGGAGQSAILESAVQYAHRKNVTLIAATGNDGQEGVRYPARFKECIAVSAVGPNGMITPYSTWGNEVDIAAPGGDQSRGMAAGVWQNTIMAQQSFFGRGRRADAMFSLQGTSMATPHVSGVAALLVSLGEKDPDEIRSILRKSAKAQAPANRYGAGLLDAGLAVQSVNRANRYNWVQLGALGGTILLLMYFSGYLKTSLNPMFFAHRVAIGLALGLLLPFAIEKLFGFGSKFNFIGHSTAIPILVLLTTKVNRASLWPLAAFTLGVMVHLFLDADSAKTPFQVHPQNRVTFWLYANIAAGALFIWSAYRETAGRSTFRQQEAA